MNLCIAAAGCGMSRCGAKDDEERCGCAYFFPAGPWSNGCMHYRPETCGHCDNHAAQHDARNNGVRHESTG
jgi:hypothetical protein